MVKGLFILKIDYYFYQITLEDFGFLFFPFLTGVDWNITLIHIDFRPMFRNLKLLTVTDRYYFLAGSWRTYEFARRG